MAAVLVAMADTAEASEDMLEVVVKVAVMVAAAMVAEKAVEASMVEVQVAVLALG